MSTTRVSFPGIVLTLGGLAAGLVVFYYRPTFEIGPAGSIRDFAFMLGIPLIGSAGLAFAPPLRHNARLAVAFCGALALAFAALIAVSEQIPNTFGTGLVVAVVPIAGLFTASRVPTTNRFPWTLLLIGPIAYWLGLFVAMYVWLVVLGNQP